MSEFSRALIENSGLRARRVRGRLRPVPAAAAAGAARAALPLRPRRAAGPRRRPRLRDRPFDASLVGSRRAGRSASSRTLRCSRRPKPLPASSTCRPSRTKPASPTAPPTSSPARSRCTGWNPSRSLRGGAAAAAGRRVRGVRLRLAAARRPRARPGLRGLPAPAPARPRAARDPAGRRPLGEGRPPRAHARERLLRVCREVVLHSVEDGDAERIGGFARSLGLPVAAGTTTSSSAISGSTSSRRSPGACSATARCRSCSAIACGWESRPRSPPAPRTAA